MLNKRQILLFFLLPFFAKAQTNLVPNFSFEDTIGCPTATNQLYLAPPWVSINSSDYFNNCNSSGYGANSNIAGGETPKTGNAFAGFQAYAPSAIIREYVQIQLSSPLVIGKKYCVSFYVNLSDSSKYGCNNLGACISTTATNTPPGTVLPCGFLVANEDTILINKTGWHLIDSTFIADSAYKYLSIGNFFDNSATQDTFLNGPTPFIDGAYYFVDDVSLLCCDCEPSVPNNYFVPTAFSPNGDGQNDTLYVRGQNIKSIVFTIYNRLGEKVFETTDISKGWDGSYNGESLNNAVFVYYLSVNYADDSSTSQKGDISLIK